MFQEIEKQLQTETKPHEALAEAVPKALPEAPVALAEVSSANAAAFAETQVDADQDPCNLMPSTLTESRELHLIQGSDAEDGTGEPTMATCLCNMQT